jgi:hypothetical protein
MVPLGHWQVELVHTPPPHELPHAPQLAGSLVTLVHSPLQLTKPVGHDWRQTPLWQV